MPNHDDLSALFLNCTLKRSPERSHTADLLANSRVIMEAQGVACELVRVVDGEVAFGVYPDMTEHGWQRDTWPELYEKVLAADILVVGSPIWLGEKSSVATMVIERLYGHSGELNDRGQSVFYGRVGGCVVTGNEDGIKHVSMGVLYALQHIGYTIPPQADCGWIGEAGPGPSYGDEPEDGRVPIGHDNDFTRRNTTIMTWNLLHMARLLRDDPIPPHGNDRRALSDGARFDHPELGSR